MMKELSESDLIYHSRVMPRQPTVYGYVWVYSEERVLIGSGNIAAGL
jgi:hypothetical protein